MSDALAGRVESDLKNPLPPRKHGVWVSPAAGSPDSGIRGDSEAMRNYLIIAKALSNSPVRVHNATKRKQIRMFLTRVTLE